MMRPELLTAVKELINQQNVFFDIENDVPHDYTSLMSSVLKRELEQECVYLLSILNDPDFVSRFRERCAFRETDVLTTIPFCKMPESLCNKLYWNIALAVLAPSNLKEILAILLPSVTQFITIDLTKCETTTEQTLVKKSDELIVPEIQITDNSTLTTLPPDIVFLNHSVIYKDTLFHLEQIANFPLAVHAKLKALLDQHYADISNKTYRHNFDFQTLADDILRLVNGGSTPKKALQQLINGLLLGGSRVEGSESKAGQTAIMAVARFAEYYQALPENLRLELSQLSHGGQSLEGIFKNQIENAQCVEVTANNLQNILDGNNPLLNSRPTLLQADLDALKSKYKLSKRNKQDRQNFLVNPLIDPHCSPFFPAELTTRALEKLNTMSVEDFSTLMYRFPPYLYDTLLKNIKSINASKVCSMIGLMLGEGFYNTEQKTALLQAIIANYEQLNPSETFFSWLSRTKNTDHMAEAYMYLSPAQRRHFLYSKDNQSNTLLHLIAANPKQLKLVLAQIQEDIHQELVMVQNSNGETVLHLAAGHAESLKLVLSLFPESNRNKLFWSLTKDNNVVAHYIQDPQAMAYLLENTPKAEILALLCLENRNNNTPLLNCTANPEILKLIFHYLSESDKRLIVTKKGRNGLNLLHHTAKIPDSLQVVLSLYSRHEKAEVLSARDMNLNTPLQDAAENTKNMDVLLKDLNTEEKTAILRLKNREGSIALHRAAKKLDTLTNLLNHYPREEILAALSMVNNERKTPLHHILRLKGGFDLILSYCDHETKKALLAVLHEDRHEMLYQAIASEVIAVLNELSTAQQIDILLKRYPQGKTLLHQYAPNYETFQNLFNRLPAALKIRALNQETSLRQTVLTYSEGNYNSLKLCMDSYSADELRKTLRNRISDPMISFNGLSDESGGSVLLLLSQLSAEEQRVFVDGFMGFTGFTYRSEPIKKQALLNLLSYVPSERLIEFIFNKNQTIPIFFLLKNEPSLLSAVGQRIPLIDRWTFLTKTPEGDHSLAILDSNNANAEYLQRCLDLLPEEQLIELIPPKNSNNINLLTLLTTNVELSSLPRFICILQRIPAKLRFNTVRSILNKISTKEYIMKALSALLTKEEMIELCKATDVNGNTVFHQKPTASLPYLLHLLPEMERAKAVTKVNALDENALFYAVADVDSFKILFNCLSPDDRLTSLTWINKNGNSVISLAKDCAHTMNFILTQIPNEKRWEVFNSLYKSCPASAEWIIDFAVNTINDLPVNERLALLLRQDDDGKTLLSSWAENLNSLKRILSSLPPEQKMPLLKQDMGDGKTVFNQLIKSADHESVANIIAQLTPTERLEIFTFVDENNQTILHKTVHEPSLLDTFLALLSKEQQVEAVEIANNTKVPLLDLTLQYPCSGSLLAILSILEDTPLGINLKDKIGIDRFTTLSTAPNSFRIALKSHPAHERYDLLFERNSLGDHVLDNFEGRLAILNILDLFTVDQQKTIIDSVNGAHNRLLYNAIDNPAALITILSHYPITERAQLICRWTPNGYSILEASLARPNSMDALLNNLPEEDRIAAIQTIPLSKLIYCSEDEASELMSFLLSRYPHNQLVPLLKQPNANGDILIFELVQKPKLLKQLFNVLSEQQIEELLLTTNNFGETFLKCIALSSNLQYILFIIPQKFRLQAFNITNCVIPITGFRTVMDLLTRHERNTFLLSQNTNGDTILHLSAPEFIECSLGYFDEDKRLDILMSQNNQQESLVDKILKNQSSLKVILTLLPEHQRWTLLQAKAKIGGTFLEAVYSDLPEIIELLPVHLRLTAFKCQNTKGEYLFKSTPMNQIIVRLLSNLPTDQSIALFTLLFNATDDHLSKLEVNDRNLFIKNLVLTVPPKQRLEFLFSRNHFGKSIWLDAKIDSEIGYEILLLLPIEDRFTALTARQLEGQSILHVFTAKYHLMRTFLSGLSTEQVINALTNEDKFGNSVLYAARNSPICFKYLFNLIPLAHQNAVVTKKNHKNESLLSQLFEFDDNNWPLILSSLPESLRLAALKEPNANGISLLEQLKQNDSKLILLKLLPSCHRREAFYVLNITSMEEKSVIKTLELLPHDERFDALVDLIYNLYHFRIHKDLVAIIKPIPLEKRAKLLCLTNANGRTLLDETSEDIPDIITPEQVWQLVDGDTVEGRLIFESLLKQPPLFKKLLDESNEVQRVSLLMSVDEKGNTLLHKVNNVSLLSVILKFLSVAQVEQLMKTANHEGNTALHRATTLFANLLKLIPEAQLPMALYATNSSGATVIHQAVKNGVSLNLLKLPSSNAQLTHWMTLRDNLAKTPLDYLHHKHSGLFDLLNEIKKEEWLRVLKTVLMSGEPLIDRIIGYDFDALITLLTDLPIEDRYELLTNLGGGVNFILMNIYSFSSLAKIVALLPETPRLGFILKKFSDRLHYLALKDPDNVPDFIKLFPAIDHYALLIRNDSNGNTLLHCCVKSQGAFKQLFNLLNDEEQERILNTTNHEGNTMFSLALSDGCFNFMWLDLYKKAHRVKALAHQNNKGNTILHLATESPPYLLTILNSITRDEALQLFNIINNEGISVLHKAANSIHNLRLILPYFSHAEQLERILQRNTNGDNLFDLAARDTSCLSYLFNLFPKHQRPQLIRAKNSAGNNLLHKGIYANSERLLELLLDYVPSPMLPEILNETNLKNESVLEAAFNAKIILKRLSPDQLFEVVKTKDSEGKSLLHYRSLTHYILDRLPAVKKTEALELLDDNDNGLLHWHTPFPASFDKLLTFYPADQQFSALKRVNKDGETALHWAFARSIETVTAIMNHCSTEQQKELLNSRDKNGNTPLQCALDERYPDFLKRIPRTLLHDAVLAVDGKQNNQLHRHSQSKSNLQALLECFSADEHVRLILSPNSKGINLLCASALNLNCLAYLLTLLPQQIRVEEFLKTKILTSNRHDLNKDVTSSKVASVLSAFAPEDRFYILSEFEKNTLFKRSSSIFNLIPEHHRVHLDYQDYLFATISELRTILLSIPENHRYVFITRKNRANQNVLNQMGSKPKALSILFDELPYEHRLHAVHEGIKSLLNEWVNTSDCLEVLLEHLQTEDRLPALMLKNQNGQTLLSEASKNPVALNVINRFIPEKERIQWSFFRKNPTQTANTELKEISELGL